MSFESWRGRKVADIMKTALVTLKVDDTVADAARLMREHGIGFLPVCDANMRVKGVLTDRDIVTRVIADGRATTTAVVDAMTLELVRCRSDDTIAAAAASMADAHKGRILVTGPGDVLEGVVSLSDLAWLDEANAGATLGKVAHRESQDSDQHAPR